MVLSSWRSTTARVQPVHEMNADLAPGGRQPSDRCHPHPPLPIIIIITQPESCKGAQSMLQAYCSGCRDKHNCWWRDAETRAAYGVSFVAGLHNAISSSPVQPLSLIHI